MSDHYDFEVRNSDKEERKPTCFDCKNAKIDPGEAWSRETPGYPACVEDCSKEFGDAGYEKADELEYNEEKLIELCHCFDPRLIKACAQCKREINQPEWSWEFWAMWYERVPCCNKECVEKANEEFKKEIKYPYGEIVEW